MNLHHRFYDLREDTWKALEELVHTGCDWLGDFPVSFGSHSVRSKSGTSMSIGDNDDVMIRGIVADPSYFIHPPKNSEKDINVVTNEIEVILYNSNSSTRETKKVKPNLLDLQALCTYISGGYSAYES